jgi:cation transport ATPase
VALFVAGFGMMQVMMYAVPVYLADGDMTPDIEQLMRWASLILTLPVVLYSAAPFFRQRLARPEACAGSAWTCRWRWASARPLRPASGPR